MKKKGFVWGLVLVLAVGLLSGCGSKSAASMTEETAVAEAPAESYSMDAAADYGTGNGSMMPAAEGSGETSSAVQGSKRIYTATLQLETTGFDEAVSSLTELVDSSGGWVSSSSVSNQSSSYRYADLTVRVPVEKYRDFLTQAGELCHLLYTQEYVDDVTEAYYDTAGRLETQQIKLERLQNLLAQAEKMEDIITIESAISETEQMIDSLSGTLQHYDYQVDYATVNISLQEVGKLSHRASSGAAHMVPSSNTADTARTSMLWASLQGSTTAVYCPNAWPRTACKSWYVKSVSTPPASGQQTDTVSAVTVRESILFHFSWATSRGDLVSSSSTPAASTTGAPSVYSRCGSAKRRI